jgi:HSP20 family protein
MKLIRFQNPELAWPGFSRRLGLQDELERLFDSPWGELNRAAQVFGAWAPALDVDEDADRFTVRAELPGLKREETSVSIHDGLLSITGERKTETKSESTAIHRLERAYGRFERTVSLPAHIAVDQVKAQYQDGILSITLPKTEAAKPKQIDVSVN